MMPSSPLSCDACGAANQTQATRCWACGQLLAASTEHTASASSPPAQQPVPPPAHLVGRYRIIGMIGTGGFSAVYKAQDMRRNDTPVAIKSINLYHLSPEQIIEATDTFNREVRLLSGLEHPNLPRIHDYFTDPEHWYLVMDFIEGETLEEYLGHTRDGYLPVEEVLEIGVQLCTVLHYLHTHQPPIIFRDVKPANIMRTPGGQFYLIDFGIARHFTPGQASDTNALGSPGYASKWPIFVRILARSRNAAPEQYSKAQTTVQTDIYNLGVTLRYLLTGKDPSGSTSGNASPDGQDQQAPGLLEQFFMRMLAVDADKRPESMNVVKRVLLQIQLAGLLYERGALHAGSLPPRVLPARQAPQRPGSAPQQTPSTVGTAGQILQPPAKRGISRRTAIIGLVGLAGLATIGGGLTLSALSQGFQGVRTSPSFQVLHPLYTYRGHTNPVSAVAWSSDSKRIASGSWDKTVQVWDANDGGNVFTYRGHSNQVWSVAWSPDGRRIASGSVDKTVQVWDAAMGGNVLTYMGHSGYVGAVAWSPDGRRIASASYDKTVQVWDAATGGNVLTYKGHSDQVNAVAWSPDGRRIASASYDKTVQVWDAATGGNVLTYKGHSDAVWSVAWSPDGRRIASASNDFTVQVWDAADGGHVFTYRLDSNSTPAAAWSPDSKRIASATLDVQIWDAADGGHAFTYRGDGNSVNAVAWSPDGKRIASGSNDFTVQVWSAP